jgi:omega-6 fatty acid desaturase (delta-12 desaturase)
VFHTARVLNLQQAVLALRFKLYDERSRRLVRFSDACH